MEPSRFDTMPSRPILQTVSGEQANANRIAAGHQPIAVVLNLVDPIGSGGRLVGGGWKAGFDKTGRGTLQHAPSYRQPERIASQPFTLWQPNSDRLLASDPSDAPSVAEPRSSRPLAGASFR
jgi:hypothetical protein